MFGRINPIGPFVIGALPPTPPRCGLGPRAPAMKYTAGRYHRRTCKARHPSPWPWPWPLGLAGLLLEMTEFVIQAVQGAHARICFVLMPFGDKGVVDATRARRRVDVAHCSLDREDWVRKVVAFSGASASSSVAVGTRRKPIHSGRLTRHLTNVTADSRTFADAAPEDGRATPRC